MHGSIGHFATAHGFPVLGTTNFPSRDLVRHIKLTRVKDFPKYLTGARHNDDLGFYDPWGRPYIFHFSPSADGRAPGPRKEMHLLIYSCGPNGIFENGEGDDVSRRGFDILIDPPTPLEQFR